MEDQSRERGMPNPGDHEVALLPLANALLRCRRAIVTLGAVGGLVGLAMGLRTPRVYAARATFLPQSSEGNAGASGLAAAAGQLGLRLPASGGAWGTALYAELIGTRALLEPIAHDTVVVVEESGRRVALMDLLNVTASDPERRAEATSRALREIVQSRELRALGAVELTATTRWPSVSLQLAERVVRRVNEFNVETRKSQAGAERLFVEARVAEAERAVRDAEDRMQVFLQRNRALSGSPELGFDRDRLQREVTLRNQLYTSLMQAREEVRIREVRDTPVITVVEPPRLPIIGESRRVVRRTVLGGALGVVVASIAALLAHLLAGARRDPSEEFREFSELVRGATPRSLRRFWP